MKSSDLPILFSGAMILALLRGRKTNTRRAINPQPKKQGKCGALGKVRAWYWRHPRYKNGGGVDYFHTDEDSARRLLVSANPYGEPGRKLWVREAYTVEAWVDELGVARIVGRYEADGTRFDVHLSKAESEKFRRWRRKTGKRGSIYCFRSLSRIDLELVDVSAERLQEITAEDAQAEGLAKITKDNGRLWKFGIPDRDGLPGVDDFGWPWEQWRISPVDAFEHLWDSINGKRSGLSWSRNPWVWAVSFKVTRGVIAAERKEAA